MNSFVENLVIIITAIAFFGMLYIIFKYFITSSLQAFVIKFNAQMKILKYVFVILAIAIVAVILVSLLS